MKFYPVCKTVQPLTEMHLPLVQTPLASCHVDIDHNTPRQVSFGSEMVTALFEGGRTFVTYLHRTTVIRINVIVYVASIKTANIVTPKRQVIKARGSRLTRQ